MITRLSVCLAAMLSASSASATELRFLLGGEDDLRDQMKGASLLLQTLEQDPNAVRRELVAAAQADYERLLAVLFEAGHFGPSISITVDGTEAANLPLTGGAGAVGSIDVRVDPGPMFLFRGAKVAPVAPNTDLPSGFARGAPAGLAVLRSTTSAAIDGWRKAGHAKAELESQEIVADHPNSALDVSLRLSPGPQLRYGATRVQGNQRVRREQILRIADIREGRIYDPDELQDSAQRLQRSGAFKSVSISESEEIGPDATLPLLIDVVEELPRRFGFGGEIGSTEGAAIGAFWLHRNLTGYADSLRIEGEISGIGGDSGGEDFELSLAYLRPSTFNPETDLFVNGTVERLDQLDFTSDRAEFVVGARRIVSDEFSYTYGLSYSFSKTTDAFGTREFSILGLPLSATYDRRNDRLNPSRGYYVEADLQPFKGFEVAGTGVRLDTDFRGYWGFGGEDNNRTVAAGRLQVAAVFGPELRDIPPDALFFSGGGGTVRGQPFQDLAVVLPTGERVGGVSFLGLSTELRQQITESIGVVGFVDAGWISETTDFTAGESHVGAGLGVRYNTGIGPIRLDVGIPVDGPNENSGFEIYIGIGQAF